MEETKHVKILVRLERDADGYPPIDVEGLWSVPVEGGNFRIDSIPFFARGLSSGDIVSANKEEGEMWFDALIEASGHSTLRIIMLDKDKAVMDETRAQVEQFGGSWEGSHLPSLFSVDMPLSADSERLFAYLDTYEEKDRLTYEVAALRSA